MGSSFFRSGSPLLLALAFLPASHGQSASVESDILHVPYIVYQQRFYQAEFALREDGGDLVLELIGATEVAADPGRIPSELVNNSLFISAISHQGGSWWAELLLIGGSRFSLNRFGPNQRVPGLNTLGLGAQPDWVRFDGDASDVGVGADGSIWVVGTDPRPGGFGIYFWNGSDWQRVDGAAVRIDVGPDGIPWTVNDKHQIHRWDNGSWIQMQGDARDIGIGADGSVWVAAGGGIFRWLGGQDWERTSGSAVRIDVDPFGHPWVVDHTDDIYQLVNGRWIGRTGAARDIGIGADGSVWVIGDSGGSGGHDIFRWNGSSWNQVYGSARQISVDELGRPWVLGSGGEIYRAR